MVHMFGVVLDTCTLGPHVCAVLMFSVDEKPEVLKHKKTICPHFVFNIVVRPLCHRVMLILTESFFFFFTINM